MRKREQTPYEILQLGTKATPQEVMARARELAQETIEQVRRDELRRAAEAIRQHPARRAFHQFWEPADTCYQDEALADFCARHNPRPFTAASLQPHVQRLIEVHCGPRSLAELALPPLPTSRNHQLKLAEMPSIEVDLPLEPWELFT